MPVPPDNYVHHLAGQPGKEVEGAPLVQPVPHPGQRTDVVAHEPRPVVQPVADAQAVPPGPARTPFASQQTGAVQRPAPLRAEDEMANFNFPDTSHQFRLASSGFMSAAAGLSRTRDLVIQGNMRNKGGHGEYMEYQRVTVPAASFAAFVDAARARWGLGHIKLPGFLEALCTKVSAGEIIDWLHEQKQVQFTDVTETVYID